MPTIRDLLGYADMTATSRYLHMTKAVAIGLECCYGTLDTVADVDVAEYPVIPVFL